MRRAADEAHRQQQEDGKQYTYYCCEHVNSKDETAKCDFMTWDVPVKDD